jgi:hypothetical protein
MADTRIFVGTLAAGEAELEACRAAVRAQRGVRVTHHVIEGLPELAAHNALWTAWASHKTEHDLFVKIDADTVLARETALAEIAALFTDPEVTGAQILLHDYFTDRLIAGLNSFSKDVVFRVGSDRLFADRVDTGHHKVLRGASVAHLAPIGRHSPAPHPRQAFHFGLHRAFKRQTEVLSQCATVWLQHRDTPRSWALAGALSAGWRMRNHFDYADPRFQQAFDALQDTAIRNAKVERYARQMTRQAA